MFDNLLHYGYFGIAAFLILTGCGLPIPEEAAIITAGVLAANGKLDPWLALLACLFGAVAGDSVMYFIGRRFGTALLERHPIFARLFGKEQEEKVEVLLKRYGARVILGARFAIGLRSPVYFAAGVLRFKYLRFLITDLICAAMVISLFFGLTYFYGKAIWAWIQEAEVGITIAVVLAAAIAGVWYWRRRHRKTHSSQASDAERRENADRPQSIEIRENGTIAPDKIEESAPSRGTHQNGSSNGHSNGHVADAGGRESEIRRR